MILQSSPHGLGLLESAGTLAAGRSIQQYAILLVKPKNVNRTVTALRKCCKTIRPATHPLDVLFAAMGFEGGELLGKGVVNGQEGKTCKGAEAAEAEKGKTGKGPETEKGKTCKGAGTEKRTEGKEARHDGQVPEKQDRRG